MQDDTFSYEGYLITISPQVKNQKVQFWFIINSRPIQFVSNRDTAKRLACNFIDTIRQDTFQDSRKGWMVRR